MKTKIQRVNNLIGQLEGVKKMLNNNSDCLSVLTQLKAIKAGIGSLMNNVVEYEFETCMHSLSKKDKTLFKKLKTYVGTN